MKFTPASPKFTELLKNSLAFKFFVGAATGLFAKALSIILGAFLICGIEKLDRCYNAFTKFISLDQTLIESLTQSDLTSYDFISALILAPIIENIIFPLGFKVWAFLSKLAIFPVLTITVLSYWAHKSSGSGLSGAILFFVLGVLYANCLKVLSKKQSYWITVIAHFIFNFIALIIRLF